MSKKRYAIVGVSGRSAVYTKAILNDYKNTTEIVALLDSNHARIKSFNDDKGTDIPGYSEDEFDKMMAETKPDAVIISTTDSTHHIYVVAAMEHNIEAVCEKPLTTDAQKVREILAAEKKSTGRIVVTHNYRYNPAATKIKELMVDGVVGKPTQVDFNYFLDTYHGASYFKRWNRYKGISGSLLITKASHHFDLVNWMIDQEPVEVFAYGALNCYGSEGPENPKKVDGRRCSSCEKKCSYYKRHSNGSNDEHLVNFNNPGKNDLFAAVDGYYADRCIFDSDIDTWDTFSLVVRYDGGTMMTYSLNASLPYEGWRMSINGTEGRLESDSFLGGNRLPFPEPPPQNVRYYPMFGGREVIEIIKKDGGHGGSDPMIIHDIFNGADENDKAQRFATSRQGAMAVLIGVAARESLETGKPVKIEDLLSE